MTQSRLLIKQWSFGFIDISPLTRSKIHEKLFWFYTRVLFSAQRRPIILLVNYDSCWQHQNVGARTRSMTVLPQPIPALLLSPFFAQLACVASISSRGIPLFCSRPNVLDEFARKRLLRPVIPCFFALAPTFSTNSRGNACYAGYRAVFDSRSSLFSPKPHGNACYAGYKIYW